jgi:hypothetical protein
MVTWSEDPKTDHKKLYSKPNPMEGEIKEDLGKTEIQVDEWGEQQ